MARTGFLSNIASFLGDIGRAQHAVRSYDSLNRLSDKALAARGMSRGDLPQIAFKSAFGER